MSSGAGLTSFAAQSPIEPLRQNIAKLCWPFIETHLNQNFLLARLNVGLPSDYRRWPN
jgi:hypothetical protein